MNIDNRQTQRIPDFARARISELCQFPGYLEDVSRTGCKVRFSHSFEVDTDQEYTLTVLPAFRSGIREFDLIVQPQWVKKEADCVEIGFSILCCPGICQFKRYVEILAELEEAIPQEA